MEPALPNKPFGNQDSANYSSTSFRADFLAFTSLLRNVTQFLTPKPERKQARQPSVEVLFPVHRLKRTLSLCSIHPITKQTSTFKKLRHYGRRRRRRLRHSISEGVRPLPRQAFNPQLYRTGGQQYNKFKSRVHKLKLTVSFPLITFLNEVIQMSGC